MCCSSLYHSNGTLPIVFRGGRSSSDESLPGSLRKSSSLNSDVDASFREAFLSRKSGSAAESSSLVLSRMVSNLLLDETGSDVSCCSAPSLVSTTSAAVESAVGFLEWLGRFVAAMTASRPAESASNNHELH